MATTSTSDDRVLVRPAGADDQAYVCSTWLRSMSPRPSIRDRDTRTRIDAILDHVGTRALVAHPPTMPSRIVGWLVYTPLPATRLVHYVYVREPRRRSGVARKLFEHAKLDDNRPLVYTHRGPMADELLERFKAHHMKPEDVIR